jgi:hypothetical protein
VWIYVGSAVGALVALPDSGDWSNAEQLLGTVFPIHEGDRLFMGAKHTLPELPSRMGIMIWQGNERILRTLVTSVGNVGGQPDLVVLRAEDGVPAFGGMASLPDGPPCWLEVTTAGYPADAVLVVSGDTLISVRGLKGYVTRPVGPESVPLLGGPGIELSFPIPAGLSGAPLFIQGAGPGGGVIGVCLASHESRTVLWDEEQDGDQLIPKGLRVVEYGLAAFLRGDEEVGIVDRKIVDIVGIGMDGIKQTI